MSSILYLLCVSYNKPHCNTFYFRNTKQNIACETGFHRSKRGTAFHLIMKDDRHLNLMLRTRNQHKPYWRQRKYPNEGD